MIRNKANILSVVCCLGCYLLSVLGFDVHYCGDNGRIYVEPLFAGISCERIHPDSPCHDHCRCDGDEECCSDTIAVLDIAGDGSGVSVQVPAPDQMPAIAPSSISVYSNPSAYAGSGRIYSYPPGPPNGRLSLLCVLRV